MNGFSNATPDDGRQSESSTSRGTGFQPVLRKKSRLLRQVVQQSAYVADGERDVLFRDRQIACDLHGVVVIDHSVITDFIEGSQDAGHLQVAFVNEDLGIAAVGRQRAFDIAEMNVEQLAQLSEMADPREDVLAGFVARARRKT